jgi:hypothetical protein
MFILIIYRIQDSLHRIFITYSYTRAKKERNILHTVTRNMTNWIGHVLHRKCLLKQVIEGNVEGTERRGRRRKQLLDDLQEKRKYWNLRGSARLHSVENSLWKRLWICRMTQYVIIQFTSIQWMFINPLKTKGNLFYVRTQCVSRSKHSPPRL